MEKPRESNFFHDTVLPFAITKVRAERLLTRVIFDAQFLRTTAVEALSKPQPKANPSQTEKKRV